LALGSKSQKGLGYRPFLDLESLDEDADVETRLYEVYTLRDHKVVRSRTWSASAVTRSRVDCPVRL
jgi:hypothetical protein